MARALTTAQAAAIAAPKRSTHVRVLLENSDAAMVDVTDLHGFDWLEEVQVTASEDDPISQATVTLRREVEGVSLAPLVEGSAANLDSTHQYAPFVYIGRAVEVYVATMMEGQFPADDDWVLLWEGTVDDPEWGGDRSVVRFTARDSMGVLHDVMIEDKATYGNDSPLEPIEDVMQDILDEQFGASAITLNVEGDPDFGIREYDLAHVPVFDALREMADLQGWNLHQKWDADASPEGFAITYYEPNREGADASGYTPDHTLGPDDYFAVSEIRFIRAGVRNAGELIYRNENGVIAKVSDERAGSSDPQTRRFIRLDETEGPVRTQAQATSMLTAVMDDLSSPPVEQKIDGAFLWPLELGDMVRYEANGVHYDTDQDWATFGYTHILNNQECTTVIQARGKPAGGFARWLRRERTDSEDATILRVAASYADGTATVAVEANRYTAELLYQEWDGSAWDTAVSFATGASGEFAPAQSTTAKKLYRVYGEDVDGNAGEPVEVSIDKREPRAATDAPEVSYVSATVTVASGNVTADVVVAVADDAGASGTLSIWSNPATSSSPDPTGAPDQQVTVADGQTAGPSGAADVTATALNDISMGLVTAPSPKAIWVEWVSSDGRSTGPRPYLLVRPTLELEELDTSRFDGNLPRRVKTAAGEVETNAVLADADQLDAGLTDGLGRFVVDMFDKDGDELQDVDAAVFTGNKPVILRAPTGGYDWNPDDTLEAPTVILPTVGQSAGADSRVLAKGHQSGSGLQDGDPVTFSPAFQGVPAVFLAGGLTYNASITGDQMLDLVAQDTSASGFTLRAKNLQRGTTANETNGLAPGPITTAGATLEANLDPGNASGDSYTVGWDISLAGGASGGGATIAIDTNANDGSGWIERATKSYIVGSGDSPTYNDETRTINVSGLGLGDDIRVRIKSIVGTATVSVTGNNVVYLSTSGDTEEAATGTGYEVSWQALAVS